MEMFYLVLHFANAAAIIPEKYPNLAQCENAGKLWFTIYYKCIPAPKYEYSAKDVQPLGRMPQCTVTGMNGELVCK